MCAPTFSFDFKILRTIHQLFGAREGKLLPRMIPAGKFDTVVTERAVSKNEVDWIANGQREGFIGTQIWYQDFWNNSWTDRACFKYFRPEKKWQLRNRDNCEAK
jgi:hypothetical protein